MSLIQISLTSFFVCVGLYFQLYGWQFIEESLLYHISRSDTRHNFSPYFYALYLAADDGRSVFILKLGAFIPQIILIFWLSIRYHRDLPFCWLITTFSFVVFNKVITSQYFIWFMCLIPVAQTTVNVSFIVHNDFHSRNFSRLLRLGMIKVTLS
ncbi:hypothetical protein AB6A40_011538 [Gnathostoma spinigerum]|uniref:GPI alpha-1,4-mannosyltransferase I, catalytic subunit n=1 Tax=Gnathostoma spinigerum TaxID=75299 RepID=A0ABD6F3J4_9BILA